MDDATRRSQLAASCRIHPGPLAARIDAGKDRVAAIAAGVWRRDPSVWSADAGVQRKIANRLGWLDSPALMLNALDRLRACADGVRRDGFTDVVLLGMGGSSLAPEVLRAIGGTTPGYPRFQMIDSTDPASVEAAATAPRTTLYVLASKSGGTIEPNSLAAHFRARLEGTGVVAWGRHFVAITDEGTLLAERARKDAFRDTFINPSDIGGRYSALSYFGLVPAALMGQDVGAIVNWGLAMLAAAHPDAGPISANPAVALGLAIAAAAGAGRDKLTLVTPPSLEPLGLWVEQLVAESTGKAGVGVVPITGEPEIAAQASADRLFVNVRMGDDSGEARLTRLLATGSPVIDILVPEPLALGAEFVRWELATAVAGALLGVNPFDEPNVQQAKDATGVLLGEYKTNGTLPVPAADATNDDGVTLTLSRAAKKARGTPASILTQVSSGDYVAILAYLGPSPELMAALAAFRRAALERTNAATTFGYGPRYLHSTGQLHKGGSNHGVFVLVTATPARDVPIPGEAFSFGTLELAQGLGDFASLDREGRRAVHVHLPKPDAGLLARVLQSLT